MPTTVTQRIGPNTRYILYMEGTRGQDAGITAGTVLPVRAKVSYIVTRPEVEVPYFNGTLQGFGSASGPIGAAGMVPCSMELTSIGAPLKMPFGTVGYSRTALVTGSVHAFWPPATTPTALSAQIQFESLEPGALYERTRYNILRSIATAYAQGGAAPLDLDFIGTGDVAYADLGGTKTDNGVGSGVSVYNGIARLAIAALSPTWLTLGGISNFKVALNTGAYAVPVAFNDGVAGAVNQGIPKLTGMLELLKEQGGAGAGADFTFLNYAINRNVMSYDCEWADAAVSGPSTFPSKWLRLVIATLRFGRKGTPGGDAADLRDGQDFTHIFDTTLSKVAAESFGTVVGPYNIGASTNIFAYKVDGGAVNTVALTQGAARTAAQVVADLNADGTFGPLAVADVHNGRVRATSKQTGGTGASSSFQFNTGTANNCAAILGFNNTAITGFDAPYVFRLYNAQNANY
jgi:hypothetical protein